MSIVDKIIKYKTLLALNKNKYCCLCKKNVADFLPYQRGWKHIPKAVIALDVIGSDVDNFSCPVCGCHDRERHLFLYFKSKKILERMANGNILHFAPEPGISTAIKNMNPSFYVQADLMPTEQGIEKINIQNIPFDAEFFDLVIANHVLEHVDDDLSALSELYRILKKGGFAILQTPYSNKLEKTWSDLGIDDDFSRLQLYGQEDHVRLYGKDIFHRFESVGFVSRVIAHDEELADIAPVKYGVNRKEPLFLFEKR
jgi:SAM-dependent methyltransferase